MMTMSELHGRVARATHLLPVPARTVGQRLGWTLLSLLCGAAVGAAAWGAGREPVLTVVMGALAMMLPRGRHVALLLIGYMVAATRLWVPGAIEFAGGLHQAAGVLAVWLVANVAIGALWGLLAWRSAAGSARRLLAVVAAQVLLLAPPLWVLGVAHVSAWAGFVLAGTSWIGLAAGIVGPAALIWGAGRMDARAGVVALVMLAGLTSVSQIGHRTRDLLVYEDLTAVPTQRGNPAGAGMDAASRLPGIAKSVREYVSQMRANGQRVRTIVFPESTIGYNNSALPELVAMTVRPVVQELGVTVVLGIDRVVAAPGVATWDARERHVSALVVAPGEPDRWVDAGQPMPGSLWRPWEPDRHYQADWRSDQRVLVDGKAVWLSFCFEDVMPGRLLAAIATRRIDAVASMANLWWFDSEDLVQAQARSVESITRLFTLPLVRAVNRPPPRP